MKKVAFIYSPSDAWVGGKNYYISLFTQLNKTVKYGDIVVFTGDDSSKKELSAFENIKTVQVTLLKKNFFRLLSYWNILFSENLLLFPWFAVHRIKYLSHSYINSLTGIKSIPWIPDFQHCYLPELFTSKEIKRRNRRAVKFLNSKHMVVSSYSAYSDAYRFFSPKGTVHIYRFRPLPVSEQLSSDFILPYSLPKKFVFLPNQFWKHKNHLIFFEAVGKLKDKGISIPVICTGTTSDYRNPGYFSAVTNFIKANNLESSIQILGLVDRRIFNLLLKTASVLVNPSCFEGWSTTVEEAKMSGKAMLLSDLPVHREQVEFYSTFPVLFFDPCSVDSCIEQLEKIWMLVENCGESEIKPTVHSGDDYCSILKKVMEQ